MSWETFNEEGFRTLHDVQSFRGVRNPARSQNARFSLAHRLAATFSGAGNGNGMSAMRVLRFASAARAGSVSRPSSLWRPTKCAWMFGRRPGASRVIPRLGNNVRNAGRSSRRLTEDDELPGERIAGGGVEGALSGAGRDVVQTDRPRGGQRHGEPDPRSPRQLPLRDSVCRPR